MESKKERGRANPAQDGAPFFLLVPVRECEMEKLG